MGSSSSAASLQSSALLEAVAEVARIAGAAAMKHFKSRISVDVKEDGSPVTIADREAETAAREWIRKRFPRDGILGEEFGTEREDAACRWLLDPIDGTKSFVAGVPLWGSMVAVAAGDRVLAGAVCFPGVDETIVAAPGAGCWWNGSRCHVSDVSELSQAVLLTTDDRFPDRPERVEQWRALTRRARVSRTWGDCYGYLLVATGRAEAMVDPVLAPWDSAALQPLIVEAGGVFSNWEGLPTAFGGSAVATNAALAAGIREALR
ncbi:MAG: histidinol-phosphatase [Gemmatimonadaceae bacterium]|nr:histidinol-phosphatase [Gemmatimonadaceae bacterium]